MSPYLLGILRKQESHFGLQLFISFCKQSNAFFNSLNWIIHLLLISFQLKDTQFFSFLPSLDIHKHLTQFLNLFIYNFLWKFLSLCHRNTEVFYYLCFIESHNNYREFWDFFLQSQSMQYHFLNLNVLRNFQGLLLIQDSNIKVAMAYHNNII